MDRLITAFFLAIVFSVGIFAQSSDQYNKDEFYVGYSNQQVSREISIDSRRSLNGVEASYVRNFHRFFGFKTDFSAGYQKGNASGLTQLGTPLIVGSNTTVNFVRVNYDFRSSAYNFLGGVQIKDNASDGRYKPFAHALIGAAHRRFNTKKISCVTNCPATSFIIPDLSSSETGFSAAFGGGLDIKINDKIDFRAIQADYNPMFSGSRVNNTYRFGIGLIFK